ncbi:Carboxy-terminal processing protease CtpB [bacterium HR36]|nr:Carboxy-terminal processing protease CtpB [bacterium HR36]
MVAGAIQSHAQAVHIEALIVGRTTRGKGLLQQVVPLADGYAGAAYLSVARWLTPSGSSVTSRGIQPDVLVKAITPIPSDSPADMTMMPMLPHDMDPDPERLAWQTALRKAIELFCESR